jgi:hypothetical protein
MDMDMGMAMGHIWVGMGKRYGSWGLGVWDLGFRLEMKGMGWDGMGRIGND